MSHLEHAAAGHEPVLVREMLEVLVPPGGPTQGVYCDATVGLGGHARAILEHSAPRGRLIGLDRDLDAVGAARDALASFGERVTVVHAPFSRVGAVLAELNAVPLDGMLVDLGVSSPQLDRAERGFSFQRTGPLDMRMDQSTGRTAADLLNEVTQTELESLLRTYGEERFAGRIARNIIEARDRGELDSTAALAAIVARAVPGKERHKNPATRTFQALRIAVNGELAELDTFLNQAAECLRPGGRLCVIAFHSLEDRMVKRRFRALAEGRSAGPRLRILTKHIVTASDEEQARNPRARSAKLRAAERVS
jgi:16S rRNA (cytosine1402-N4)-methyltransferase